MRNPLRLALLAGAVLAGVTCTDAPTAPLAPLPAGSPGRIAIAPSFSRDAAAAWQSLAAFNLAPNNVHIVLKRPGPPEVVLLDTVVAITPGQTEISLELTVPINGPEEQLGASIQVRDGTQVLFEGTSTVTAVRAGTPGTPPGGGSNGITVDYVGPGAAARAIRISPRDQVVATGAAIAFSVTATDASGAAMTPPPIQWQLSDKTLGTIGELDGAFVAGSKRGTVTVRAATPSGITDQVTVGIVPPAQRIVTISGAGQDAGAGKSVAQPFVVEVQAADGLPVPGVAVSFNASTGASVSPASATTDAAGRASATMTVGRTPGSYTFTATAGTLGSTSVTATATPAPASAIAVVSGSGQVGAVGTAAAQPLVVRVSNEFGTPVAGASVAWAIASGGGTLSSATTVTDADGLAQVSYSYGKAAGAASVTATVTTPAGSSTATFALTAAPASVATLTIVSGSGQEGAPNAVLLPFVVKATDAQGNPAPNFSISWTTTAGSLSDAITTTGADGTASVVLTLGAAAGAVNVTASAPPSGTSAGATATFTATTTAGPVASVVKVAGDAQVAPAGSAVSIAPAVKALDAFGNRVPGALVTFAVASGGGIVTPTTVATDANGVASVGSWTLGAVPGPNTLTATIGTFGATFSATGTAASGPPAQLIAVNGNSFSYTAGVTVTAWPRVKVVDTAGIAVPGTPVSVSVTDPSGAVTSFTVTTDASGVAELHPATVTSFGGAGSYSGVASIAAASASPVSFTITVSPGPLASLVITTVPARTASIDVALAPQPVVRAVDANGNGIAGVPVTVSIVSGGGTFATSGATTVTTDATGVAAFSGLAFASGSGTQAIKFTSGSIASATADVTIFTNAPAVTGLVVSPTFMVTGSTGSWSATIANGTASAISGVVMQGWIEQGATRAASGGMTPTCGASPAGTLAAGDSCPVNFSFTVPGSGLVTGPATFVLEMMSGTSVIASAQVPVTISTSAPPAGTTNTWTGAVSSDWHTAGNWSANRVPNASDKIWIPQQAPLGLTAAGAMNYGGITLSANAVVDEVHAVQYSIGIDVQDYTLEVTGAALDMGGSSITSSTGLGSVKLSGPSPLLNVYDMPAMTVLNGARVAEYGEPWVNGNLDILGGTFDMSLGDYLDVDGTLRIEGASAALKMVGNIETGSNVYVYGSLVAAGAASDTTLLGGYLNVRGNIRQSATFSARSFAPQPSLYVAMEPAGDVRVSFASPAESKFRYLDISPGTSADVVREAPRAAARPMPAAIAALRAAVARREATMPERLRSRRATRLAPPSGALSAMVVNPGVNFETNATIADYLHLDAPVGVLTSGTAVTVTQMYVNDNAAFDIAAGAAFTVTGSCQYSSYAPQVAAGICPNPQYYVASMEPVNNLSDLFVLPSQALPADFGVRLLDNSPTPAPVAGAAVTFNISGDGDACTATSTAPVITDAGGVARVPLAVGGRGSCVITAYNGDASVSAELRVYAIPAPPAGGANKVYLGTGTGTWGDPAAWVDPATGSFSTPQAGDRAVVAYAGVSRQALTLASPATAGKVWLTPYASVDLNGQQLTVTDSITGGGSVHGTGMSNLLFAGTNQAVEVNSGSVAKTTFGSSGCSTQSFRLAASIASGETQVNCPLDLAGNSFTVTGALTTAGNGAFTMGSGSSMFVAGDATFGGAAGNITNGSFFFARNLAVTGTSSFVVPAAVQVLFSSADVPQSITFPASANSNSLGSLLIQNKLGAQFSGVGNVPANLYLYAAAAAADATKFTIQSGANLTVTTQADVNQFALLTIDGTLTVPTLSIGTSGAVVVNGVLAVQNCPQSSQVTGSGSRGACAPPQ